MFEAIQRLTQNQTVLRFAIRGIREQMNTALQKSDYPEVNHCRRQQLFLERELRYIRFIRFIRLIRLIRSSLLSILP